jgi:hypothetical protein
MKYKIKNNSRSLSRIDLENGEHVFLDFQEEKIIESKPISLMVGFDLEEIKSKKTIKED